MANDRAEGRDARADALERALDRGGLTELPDNVPPGLMGEVAPSLTKVDDFRPTLSSGIIQESTPATRWLTIMLFYILILTGPVAAWLLWRDPSYRTRTKVIATVAGVIGYAVYFWARSVRPV